LSYSFTLSNLQYFWLSIRIWLEVILGYSCGTRHPFVQKAERKQMLRLKYHMSL